MRETIFPSDIMMLCVILFVCLLCSVLFRTFSGLPWKGALLLSFVVGAVMFIYTIRNDYQPMPGLEFAHESTWFLQFLSLISGAAILARLYQKWIGQELSEEERQPGATGFRAWFGAGNLLMAVVFAGATSMGFHYPFVTLLMLTLGAVSIYPLIITLSSAEAAIEQDAPERSPVPVADTNAERDRVLRMLENGKITPDDGAELLKAIGTSNNQAPLLLAVSQQRFFLVGGLLVLFGFLLPWISIDLGKELSSSMKPFNIPVESASGLSTPQIDTPVQRLNGGDIRNGLGWIVLFAGLVTPAIWLFARSIEPATRKTVSLLNLGIGAVILLYLMSSAFRHLSFGFLAVVAGYVLLAIAVFRKTTSTAASGGLATAAMLQTGV